MAIEPSQTMFAGALAGFGALVVFVVLHAMWIAPIWPILTLAPIAAFVGALVAWPFDDIVMRGSFLRSPVDGLALGVFLLTTLIPTAVFGILTGPVDRDRISAPAILFPLLLAAPSGAVVGLLLTGSGRGSVGLAVAALAIALTLGHNLPFFPIGSAGWEKAIGLVVAVELAAGVVFSFGIWWLRGHAA